RVHVARRPCSLVTSSASGGWTIGHPQGCRSSRSTPCHSPSPVTCLPVISLAVILDLMSDVTRILNDIEHGDPHATGQLLPLVYDELRKLAAQKMAQEQPGQTLQATALVHEAYMRLLDGDKAPHWNSRGHFFAAAAEAMRRILVERARSKHRVKRGGARRQE